MNVTVVKQGGLTPPTLTQPVQSVVRAIGGINQKRINMKNVLLGIIAIGIFVNAYIQHESQYAIFQIAADLDHIITEIHEYALFDCQNAPMLLEIDSLLNAGDIVTVKSE